MYPTPTGSLFDPTASGNPTPVHGGTPAYGAPVGLGLGTPLVGASGYTPAGSAAASAASLGANLSWLMPGLLVRMRDSAKTALVRSVAPDGRCMLTQVDNNVNLSAAAENLLPEPYGRNDRVKAIAGPRKGASGRCIHMDAVSFESMVKFDGAAEAELVKMNELCKLPAE